MKVIICGSRYLKDVALVARAVEAAPFRVDATRDEIVVGGAGGVDSAALDWAWGHRCATIRNMPADWDKHGRKAGPIRNQEMVDYADACIAIPCPKSKGTWDTVRRAEAKGIPVYVHLEALPPPVDNPAGN